MGSNTTPERKDMELRIVEEYKRLERGSGPARDRRLRQYAVRLRKTGINLTTVLAKYRIEWP